MGASRWSYHAFCALLAVLLYLNAISGEFVYDDLTYVQENPSVLGVTGVFDQPLAPQHPELGLYRPITVLTYRWTYQLAGMDPFPFHLVNALLHALASLLVVSLAGFLGANRQQAGLAGLLFAAHSIHVEAVAWVVGRAEILATCFGLLTILAHGRPTDRSSDVRTWLAALLFGAGALSKETALCLPAFLVLHDLIRREAVPLRRVALRLLPSALVCLAVVVLRSQVLGRFGPDVSAHAYLGSLTLLERAQLGLAVVGRSLRLLSVPYPTSIQYDPRPFFTATASGLGALVAVSGVALAAGLRRGRNLPGLLGLVLLAVSLLPVLHLVPFGEVFADRFLYLASTGFCLTGACLLFTATHKPGPVRLALALVLLVALSALTLRKNPAFRNSIALWEDAVRSQPDSAFAHFQLAYFYRQAGLFEYESDRRKGALYCYKESLRVEPDHPRGAEAHLWIGEYAAARQGDAPTAAAHYREALRRAPGMFEAMLDLAALQPQGVLSRDEARELLVRALSLNPPEEFAEAARAMLQQLDE